jgi:hypothetical protein
MPERWERELRKLGRIEPNEHVIRERAAQGPSSDRGLPRRNALVAGIVAGAVAISGVAFLGRLDESDREIGGEADDLPTLLVTFESNGTIGETPSDAEPIRRVDTRIAYGDTIEEDFTSTTPIGAHVDYIEVDRVTRFAPGPTVGSPVRIEADGGDPRILIAPPEDWPQFDRFTPVDALPSEPGDYVLVFEADYPEGVARTARFVRLVPQGALQLIASEGEPGLGDATASAYLDGRRTSGFLSSSWYMAGDVGDRSEPQPPRFEDGTSLRLASGTPLILGSEATEAYAGLVESYEDFDPDGSLPLDLSSSTTGAIEGEPGRQLLAVDVSWRHGTTGFGQDGTEERALFFFPVEIVTEQETAPGPAETPSPSPAGVDTVVIDIRRTSEETGDPEATARLGDQEVWMCPDGWSLVNGDGTREEILFDCGQEATFMAPAGAPIVVSGDVTAVNATARLSGSDDRTNYRANAVPAIDAGSVVFYQYEVSWDDGSEASFWLLLTVQGAGSPAEEPGIVVSVFGVGERSEDMPTATFSFAGETEAACTQEFEWTLDDGTSLSGPEQPADAECTGRAVEVPPGTSIAIQAASTTRVVTTRATTQFFEGDVGLVVAADWPNGRATFVIPLTVASDTPDLELVVLDCRPEDQIPITPPENRDEPAGSAYIVGNIPGFERTDVVEQMTRQQGGESDWAGVWQVVRDGSVVASVDYPDLTGAACEGTGIGGA